MKKYTATIILLAVFCSVTSLFAQVKDEPINEFVEDFEGTSQVFVSVEEMPEFPGGEAEFMKYLQQNIHYPTDEKQKKIVGTVYIYFVIGKNGKVKDAKVVRAVKGGDGLNAEALRVINEMPTWKPGRQNGRLANVQFTLPIKFTLK